jgi:ABC-type Fe3+ transport system substrate-binding protein
MENKYFNIKDTLWEICNKYPETIKVFAENGFEQLKDETQRAVFGKNISLEMALNVKLLDHEKFIGFLINAIERKANNKDQNKESINMVGLLPCPVRLPLVEKLNKFIQKYEDTYKTEIVHDLKAASMGLDWLVDSIKNEESAENLSDLFISAGFDLFFDNELMGKYKKQGVFSDLVAYQHYNNDFQNEEIDLKDPDNQYSMLAVVPAVFLVNKEELGDRPVPKSWVDILKPEYKKSVSLPIADFDLFNSILIHIFKSYGMDGIKGLGESLQQSMHPSQMVKSHNKKQNKPAVTIMPYFFTKMVKEGGVMEAIWPEDGAIISPIFMLSKKEKAEKLQPIVDFFSSVEVGEILSHQGLFPSVNPYVDNKLGNNQFMWVGWDYINSNNIGKLIEECKLEFDKASKQ